MWTHGCIGDVLSLIQNGVNCKQDKSGVGDKVTRIETIADSNINYDKTGFAVLDEKQKAKAVLHKGDILFSHINSPVHVGKTAIYDGKEILYHGINLLRLKTIDAVDSSYFNMFLISLFQSGYWKRTSKQSVNQASVNQTDIKQVPFSYPPLAEQQRIVAKLDAAFAEIDRAIELAQAKRIEIDSLRASLISSLLTGEGMTASTLGEACKMYQPKTISTKDMVANGDYVVFGANGIIGRYDKYNHEHEQLLVTCRGATCGSVNISQPKSWITGNAMVIQPDLAKVSMRYMEYIFRGGIDLSKAITGSAQPQITRKSLEPIKFSYPSLKEQERVVETLDVASQELDVSMKHTKSILANYNALKSAILAQELQPSEAA